MQKMKLKITLLREKTTEKYIYMKVIIYKGIKNVEVQEREIPICGPNDVIVRNVCAGIWGTDVSAYLNGGIYGEIFPESELGYEFGHEMVDYVYE